MFIELIDEDEKVMKSWKFDCPLKKWFSDPDYYEDDCLVFYMTEEEFLQINWEYPGKFDVGQEHYMPFKEKYIDGHPLILEGWNQLPR